MIAVGSRRGWLTERRDFSLFCARARARVQLSTVRVSGVRFPCAYMLFRTLAFYSEAADPSIGRNIIPLLSFPYLVRSRLTPARIPINKKNTPGRPQNGSSFTRSPSSWHLLSDCVRTSVRGRACTRNGDRRVCVRVYLALVDPVPCSFAAYNKLATRARIIPSYWK